MEQYGIGIDLGGTKILAGIVELETGKVVAYAKKRTINPLKEQGLAERIIEAVEEALDEAKLEKGTKLRGIGIGAAGQVDRETNALAFAPNLGVQPNYPLGSLLEAHFKLPVVLGNDVEAATLGELHFGAGRGFQELVCIFVGTGIGGGLVQNGQMRRGATGTAGEIGHTVVQFEGRACGCGGRGHLEAYASRTAITKTIAGELKRGRKSILTELLEEADLANLNTLVLRSKMIAKAVEADDELVKEVLREAAHVLSFGLASVINLYNPERIILGGGLLEAVDFMFELLVRKAKLEALPLPASKVEIVRTGLGDFSGLVGASLFKKN